MKKYSILICLYLLGFSCMIGGCNSEEISTQKGEPIWGNFTTVDTEGNIVDQQLFSSCKLTMINIWATFCSSCVKEMPDLTALQEEFAGEFQVIGLVLDATDRNARILPDKKQQALSIIKTAGAEYRHILPSVSLNRAYLNDVQSVPETIFVDEDGCRIGPIYMGAKTKDKWRQIIETILESM